MEFICRVGRYLGHLEKSTSCTLALMGLASFTFNTYLYCFPAVKLCLAFAKLTFFLLFFRQKKIDYNPDWLINFQNTNQVKTNPLCLLDYFNSMFWTAVHFKFERKIVRLFKTLKLKNSLYVYLKGKYNFRYISCNRFSLK